MQDLPTTTIQITNASVIPPSLVKKKNVYKPTQEDVLIFDLGSYETVCGYSLSNHFIQFDSVVSKHRQKSSYSGNLQNNINVGNECYMNTTSLSNKKSPFDQDILVSGDLLEHLVDYSLLNLDVQKIKSPVLITEKLNTPKPSKKTIMELMFECYSTPMLTSGIDSVFAYNNFQNPKTTSNNGLIVGACNYSTDIMAVIDGKVEHTYSRKIGFGGSLAVDYLHKSLMLKYPTFPIKMASYQAKYLLHEYAEYADNYKEFLNNLVAPNNEILFSEVDIKVQFPYIDTPIKPSVSNTLEQTEKINERKRQQAIRLKQQIKNSRAKRLASKEKDLESFMELFNLQESTSEWKYITMLEEYGFADVEDLEKTIQSTKIQISKMQDQDENEASKNSNQNESQEPPTFDLIDIPDDQLSDDSKKEKKKQRLLKSSYEARQKIKLEKEKQKLLKQKQENEEAMFRKNDFDAYLKNLREKYNKVKNRLILRKRMNNQMSKRKSHLSQLKMKSIAQLANNDNTLDNPKNNKKDTFGMDDKDWEVYNYIKKPNADDVDNDSEEEDYNLIEDLEAKLIEYDLDFQENNKFSNIINEHGDEQNPNSIVTRLFNGLNSTDQDKYSLHYNIERYKVPEILFDPSIAGLHQAGITEIIDNIIRQFPIEKQQLLLGNIILTGGFSKVKNFKERLHSSLVPISPTNSNINILQSNNPSLDAFNGAKRFVNSSYFKKEKNKICITYDQYLEGGSDYCFDHFYANPT